MLLIVAYLGTIVGYPYYRPLASRLNEAPYPCQFGKCGCKTREQCRTSCCCHTKAEKIQWALERGLDPNTVAVLTEAEQEKYDSPQKLVVRPVSAKKSCCASKAVKETKSCCAKKPEAKPEEGRVVFVLGIDAQKCRGTGVEWIQAGFVALPPPAVKVTITQPEETVVFAVAASYLSPTLGQPGRPG